MRILFVLGVLLYSCAALAQTSDETALKQLVEREIDAYLASDWFTWSDCWIQEDYVSWSANIQTGYVQLIGWAAIEKVVRANFDSAPEGWTAMVRRKNWKAHIQGNMAFVTFTQILSDSILQVAYTTAETRSFEKRGAKWKIIQMSALREAPNYYALAVQLQGLGLALSKGQTPEAYATTIASWTHKNTETQALTLGTFTEWIQGWCAGYRLKMEVLSETAERVQIRRDNLAKSAELADFFQHWGGLGEAAERFYRELWRQDLKAAGLDYEVRAEGDKTIETFSKK